jgi:predicted Zn-dependent peptidase
MSASHPPNRTQRRWPAPIAAAAIVIAALLVSWCGGAAARDVETLPGRTRPLLNHTWPHPRELKFDENRFTPPDPQAALITTQSGLRVYVITDPAQRVVQLTAAAPLGRSFEQTNEVGAADLLWRLLSQQINDQLGPGYLGRIQTDQDVDLTRFTVQVLVDDWQPALSALIGVLRQPRLESHAIAAYRTGPGFARQTRGLGGAQFRPAIELSRLLSSYPLAPPEPGFAVSQEAVRRIAVRALQPRTVAIGIGGGISRDDVQHELQKLTDGWEAPVGAANTGHGAESVSPGADRWRTIDEPGYTTWIAVGHPVAAIDLADEAPVAVMTDVLNIRLTVAIREMRGLANATQLLVPATPHHGGLLHVRSGARPESIAPIMRFSLQELTRIREPAGSPTTDELEQVKGGLVLGKWQGSLDGALDASATYASETVRFGSLDHLLAWPDAVGRVTAQAVTAAARKYISPAQLGAVVIGQLEEVGRARHPRWPVALEEVRQDIAR